MSDARSIALQHYDALNLKDLDAYAALLHEDVAITVEEESLIGREAVLRYTAGVLRDFPTMRLQVTRVLAEGPETVVTEMRLANSADGAADPAADWHLAGATYQFFRVKDGQIYEIRSVYGPDPADRANVPQLPSRLKAVEILEEQAALRRVATLVAQGAPEDTVFAAVNEEVGRIVGADLTGLIRFGANETMRLVAAWGAADVALPVGDRRPLDSHNRAVRESGLPSRSSPTERSESGSFLEDVRDLGIRSVVRVPIKVDGAVWGVSMAASRQPEPLPMDAEARILGLSELVATALANAQGRTQLQQLLDEQTALRRVAELAAQGASPAQVMDAVALEASRLRGVSFATLLRYEPDGSTDVAALSGSPRDAVTVGTRVGAEDDGIAQRVLQTGRTVRVDDLTAAPGRWSQLAADLGYVSALAAPIFIQGRLWGVLVTAAHREPLSSEPEDHLERFADIAATAISGALARSEQQALADEQAALRRVAELVARRAPPDEIFATVASEASALLGDEAMTLTRFEGERGLVVLATCGGPAPVGWVLEFEPDTLPDRVVQTAKPTRVDDYSVERDAELAASFDIAAAVAVPVLVEGQVWGMLTATSPEGPIPTSIELRLTQFADLVAAAIANAENRAELAASRARVVATADNARRQIQRDVHDGAQQRLVQTIVTLRLARAALGGDTGAAVDLIDESLHHAERASTELRDLVRGILPASLTRGGLRAGVESLVAGLRLPVDVQVPDHRLPAAVETTGFFVVAEALTNVVKHANATRAQVHAELEAESLTITISDDGCGGADPGLGSGLTGLSDRVAAGDGTLAIVSPPGAGTTVRARLPLPLARGDV